MSAEYLKRNPNIKEIAFYDDSKLFADFLIKLRYDEFPNASKFFRSVIRSYVDGDKLFFDWVQNKKKENKVFKRRIKSARNIFEDGNDISNEFGLKSEEIENIFDLIEDFEDKDF